MGYDAPTAPVVVSNSDPQQQQQQEQQQQQPCLWEEGAVHQQSWVQDAGVVYASLPAASHMSQQLRGTVQAAGAVRGTMFMSMSPPNMVPVLQLQQQWAANLQCALACTHCTLAGAAADPCMQNQHCHHHQQQQCSKQQLPPPGAPVTNTQQHHSHHQVQQRQQQQEEGTWLHKLLAANAAAPLDQLTQLDLSLEQLPGLHGLGALCCQLTSLAANMNGLQHLQGLQACSGLVQLSAQVRGLGIVELPVLALHLAETSGGWR
jgi:hypothetical protein